MACQIGSNKVQVRSGLILKCPLCGKEMTPMSERPAVDSPTLPRPKQEPLYFCGQHGVMNRSTDLKDKVDQVTKKARTTP